MWSINTGGSRKPAHYFDIVKKKNGHQSRQDRTVVVVQYRRRGKKITTTLYTRNYILWPLRMGHNFFHSRQQSTHKAPREDDRHTTYHASNDESNLSELHTQVCGHPLLDSSRCLETTDSGFQAHLKSTERLYNPIDRLLSGCTHTHNRFDRYSLELVYKTSIFNACLSASRRGENRKRSEKIVKF